MKTLLFISTMLLAGQCYGQKTADLIIEYAEECYNDSTACCCYYEVLPGGFKVELFKDCSCNLEKFIRDNYGYWDGKDGAPEFEMEIKGYIHKQPTFKGFINWLERRQK